MEFKALSRLSHTFTVLGVLALTTQTGYADPAYPQTPGAFTASSTSLRSLPSSTAPKVAAMPQGVRGDVIGHRGGWVKLRLPSGKSGWAPVDRLALNTPAKQLIAGSGPDVTRVQRVGQTPNVAGTRGAGAPVAREISRSPRLVATVVPSSESMPSPTLAEPPIEALPETGGVAVSVDSITIPRSETRGDRLARKALTYRGWRYRWGATGSNGAFDCSGLTQYLYAKEGKSIPRTAREQFAAGQPVAKDKMEPGDLIFFRNTGHSGISHVGMFIGGGQFVHAAGRKKGVRVDGIDKSYYVAHWAGVRRF